MATNRETAKVAEVVQEAMVGASVKTVEAKAMAAEEAGGKA